MGQSTMMSLITLKEEDETGGSIFSVWPCDDLRSLDAAGREDCLQKPSQFHCHALGCLSIPNYELKISAIFKLLSL
jgi:hypothetical protein